MRIQGGHECFIFVAVPVSSPSPSRPSAVRPEGWREAVAFPDDADASDGASSSFHTESRSEEEKNQRESISTIHHIHWWEDKTS